MNFRKANLDDLNQLVELRKKQLIDEGSEPNIDIDEELTAFFIDKLGDGSLIQWLVEKDEEIIACGAVILYEFPPSYTNKSGKRAYIANMYTKEEYRGKGIAGQLLTKLIEEVKELGITKVMLLASTMGKPVYRKFGFVERDAWMELDI